MAEHDLVSALNHCIDRLASGQSMDDCLRPYPQLVDQLRPMLEAGNLARRVRYHPGEVSLAQNRVRERVERAAHNFRPHRANPLRRAVTSTARVAAVLILLAGVASVLAESSLPGDPLYGVKRFTESVRLAVSNNALQETFAQRRIDEIRQLQAAKRVVQVTFRGLLESLEETSVQVAGLEAQINAQTVGLGSVRVGDWVEVDAYTTPEGALVAAVIHPLGAGEPEQLPTPSLTPPATGTATSTSAPTLTESPSVTPTPTPTSTATSSPTTQPSATPSTTMTPSPSPSATAAVCAPQKPQDWITYTVQAGDTLSELASSTGTTVEELMRVNCLTDDNLIYVGQQLFLPSVPARLLPAAAASSTIVPGSTPAPGVNATEDNHGDGGDDGKDSGDDHSGEG